MNPEQERTDKAQVAALNAGLVAIDEATAKRAYPLVDSWAGMAARCPEAVAFDARRALRAPSVRFWRLPALQASLGDPVLGSMEGVGRTLYFGPGGTWIVFDGTGAIVSEDNAL